MAKPGGAWGMSLDTVNLRIYVVNSLTRVITIHL